MEIRKVRENQLELLQDICCETYRDTFGVHTSDKDMEMYLTATYAIDVLRYELAHPQSITYFLYDDEEIVGYLKLNVETAQTEKVAENALEVQRLYVRSSYKRKGYGSFLMNTAVNLAKKQKKSAIWLGVWEHNYPAQAFYASHGFKRVGEHVFPVGDQIDIDYILLKKL